MSEAFTLPTLPTIPDRLTDVRNYGMTADDEKQNRAAINRAIEECASRGGGRVMIPAGRWKTGAICMRSNVELHLERGCILDFSTAYEDYLPVVFGYRGGIRLYSASHFIYAHKAQNIALTGEGVLEGNGSFWWGMVASCPGMKDIQVANRDRRPVSERVYDTRESGVRPTFLQFVDCENVLIEGVSFRNSPSWTVHPVLCRSVTIRGISICNPFKAANTDGIDVESCARVLIEDCHIGTGDDVICIKSGRNEDAWDHMPPCEDVLIRNCHAAYGHGGATVGSETSGGIRRIRFESCTFNDTEWGIRIKTRAARGSTIEDLSFKNIRLTDCFRGGIEITAAYTDSFEDMLYNDPQYSTPEIVAERDSRAPTVRNISFEDVTLEGAPLAAQLIGIKGHELRSISLNRCTFTSERSLVIREVTGFTTENVSLSHAPFKKIRR